MPTEEQLRYPIGKFSWSGSATAEERRARIDAIAAAPALVRGAVSGLTDAQLDTPYRPGGWTVRQVVHHLADSHINSYVRFRLALTENEPAVTDYNEDLWATLPDGARGPIEPSLQLLASLHERWVVLLRSLDESQFARTFKHPARGLVGLDMNLAIYAWHGVHHVAHIENLRKERGW